MSTSSRFDCIPHAVYMTGGWQAICSALTQYVHGHNMPRTEKIFRTTLDLTWPCFLYKSEVTNLGQTRMQVLHSHFVRYEHRTKKNQYLHKAIYFVFVFCCCTKNNKRFIFVNFADSMAIFCCYSCDVDSDEPLSSTISSASQESPDTHS